MVMGFRTIRTSDISNAVLGDDEVVTVIVRGAPGLAEARQFDCSRDEFAAFVTMTDLVSLEVRRADGTAEDLVCTADEFAKLVPRESWPGLRGTRGRRPGRRE